MSQSTGEKRSRPCSTTVPSGRNLKFPAWANTTPWPGTWNENPWSIWRPSANVVTVSVRLPRQSYVPRTRDACLRKCGCRRCRPDAPPAARACAACDHRRHVGTSRLRGRPPTLRELADPSRLPSAEAPQGRRLRAPPSGHRLPLGRHLAPNGLRLLRTRVRGLPLDWAEASALELGPAARGPCDRLRAAAAGRTALKRGQWPRQA